jgi:hypothetical protein
MTTKETVKTVDVRSWRSDTSLKRGVNERRRFQGAFKNGGSPDLGSKSKRPASSDINIPGFASDKIILPVQNRR